MAATDGDIDDATLAAEDTDEVRTEAIALLESALAQFALALTACRDVGLEPAEAFRAVGIDVPAYAAPLVNTALSSMQS